MYEKSENIKEQQKNIFDLGRIEETQLKRTNKHVASTIMPDTLFTFTTELKWLIKSLKNRMLSPRYCEEDISYLNIKGMKKLAYPMKCFCDINLHKLGQHMEWYGYYGLAFSKEWGMSKKIQPLHYINPSSELRKDFTVAFRSVLSEDLSGETKSHTKLKNYLLHELMYYKPYQGKFTKRTTGKKSNKCFSDECEWRYIPNVTCLDMPQVITDDALKGMVLADYSNSLDGVDAVSLSFEYEDLKYVIVETQKDFYELINEIESWNLDEANRCTLMSKIMVWENSEGDF